jgi:hypothetical protein
MELRLYHSVTKKVPIEEQQLTVPEKTQLHELTIADEKNNLL